MISPEDHFRAAGGVFLEKECIIWNLGPSRKNDCLSHGGNNQTLNSVPLQAGLHGLGFFFICCPFHSQMSKGLHLWFLGISGSRELNCQSVWPTCLWVKEHNRVWFASYLNLKTFLFFSLWFYSIKSFLVPFKCVFQYFSYLHWVHFNVYFLWLRK